MRGQVDYDIVASSYDTRYDQNPLDGVAATIGRFVAEADGAVAEVGCGTGHWLARLDGRVRLAAGLDPSAQMLRRARHAAPAARIVRGRAEELPWATGAFDRLFCVNALHHFADPGAFLREARRVLRPSGAVLIVGLDPHAGLDRWWVYECFPSALASDRARYLPTAAIREDLGASGFAEATTDVAQHTVSDLAYQSAIERGMLDRRAASQLLLLSDAEYEAGLERLQQEQPLLRTDLRVYATIGRI